MNEAPAVFDPPPLVGMNKPALREWAKTRRAALFPPQALAEVSARLCASVRALPEWKAARHVLVYLSLPGETSVDSLMVRADNDGEKKQFYVPRCAPKRGLIIHPYTPKITPLVTGVWGLREPDAALVPPAEPSVLDLVVVPALLFTPQGHRLGYGGGYYDRFLPRLSPPCLSVGVVPSALVVPHFPVDAWDVPVGRVLTELPLPRPLPEAERGV